MEGLYFMIAISPYQLKYSDFGIIIVHVFDNELIFPLEKQKDFNICHNLGSLFP